jgi:hypothetical protein
MSCVKLKQLAQSITSCGQKQITLIIQLSLRRKVVLCKFSWVFIIFLPFLSN